MACKRVMEDKANCLEETLPRSKWCDSCLSVFPPLPAQPEEEEAHGSE